MTKEELEQYKILNKKFQESCEQVKLEMQRYDSDYLDVDSEWSLGSDEGSACHASGDVWSRGCFMGTTHVWFDQDLLTYSDEELKAHVDKLISDKQAKKEKEEQERKERQNKSKLAMYKKLKEELGL